jgi:streptogrisin C
MVGLSTPEDSRYATALGGVPVATRWSLAELEAVFGRVEDVQASGQNAETIREYYVDYPGNRVVVAVCTGSAVHVRELLAGDMDKITITETDAEPQFSSGPVRGGNGTHNHTWAVQYPPGPHPCSIGASVNEGYVTAGHCGYFSHEVRTSSNLLLGTVKKSTFPEVIDGKDSAWVKTVAGWVPKPEINGYDLGLITVPAKWAGMNESPVGTHVCRYDQTSGGPYCGKIDARNVNVTLDDVQMKGLAKLSGSCTDDGDSGGPHLAQSGYSVQGVNVGGEPTNNCEGYPQTAGIVYFQPIGKALDLMGRTMLTAHGAIKPTVQGLSCESFAGKYVCKIASYNSQGTTGLQWKIGQVVKQGTTASGTCTVGQWVDAALTASNPYGASVYNTSVKCLGQQPNY